MTWWLLMLGHCTMRLTRWGLVLPMAFCAIGCHDPAETSTSSPVSAKVDNTPISVVATVGTVADIVRNVGGRHVEVMQIMGSGVDPHLYKATRDDVNAIMSADLVFYSGLMLEGKMADTLIKMSRTKPVCAVTERIDEQFLLEPQEFQGHYDPHVWMDVSLWSQCTGAAADALAEFDPQHEAEYRAAAEAYARQLGELHDYGKTCIASIPPAGRVLITSHDAFNYFGRAYGLEVRGVQGISTESEAGLQRINELVDLIVDSDVHAVFVESSVSRKNIEALIDGARSRGHEAVIGGQLYSDAMGEAGTYEGTYIGMLDHNITVITRALGGDAPARGLYGRLSSK